MSVLKSQRSESKMQFLDTAIELHLEIIRLCKTLPNRYTHYFQVPFAEHADKIHCLVDLANDISYPRNAKEARTRRGYFHEARGLCKHLSSLLGMIFEFEDINVKKRVQRLLELIDYEIRLLEGVMKSDLERYKNLPD